jgi:hypothetical protein
METAELENPVLKDEAEELRTMAEQAGNIDADNASPSAEQTETRAPVTTETNTSSPDTTPEKKDERPRDELGRFTKTPEGEDIPESERTDSTVSKPDVATTGDGKQTESKPESEYARKQKEAERRSITWEKLEAKREEIRQAEARIAQETARLQQQAQPRQQPQQQPQYSSKDYAKFAQGLQQSGHRSP